VRIYMQLKKAANLAFKKASATLLSSIFAGVIGALCSASLLAKNQATFEVAPHASNIQQINILHSLNNSSLSLKDEVAKLYHLQNYKLIWSSGKQYNNNAFELFKVIQNAENLGLNPADYDAEVIQYFLESSINDPKILSKLDITFTHAYIQLAIHLAKGRYIQASTIQDEGVSLIQKLNEAVNNHAVSITLKNLQPSNASYSRLALALKKYRSLKDEYDPIVLNTRSLTIGDKSIEIIKLRKRLYDYGDYIGTNLHNDKLDETLALAITRFQDRHGLEADGILGKRTVIELNKPIAARIQQLELNLERSRQLPAFNQGRHLIINIPEYRLYVNENGRTIYQSRVVVGKKKNKTPVFSSKLTELVLNPYWNVPKSITSKEIIPKLQQDPDYLARNNMKVLGIFNNQTHVVNPEAVDWSSINLADLPFRIRQDPGAQNSLGRIKFIFPNAYSVYLHDTPSRHLFASNNRAYSHGCIRLEDPLGLAEVLLSDINTWSKDDLSYFVKRKRPKTIKLDNPIPIHITYMTAWVDDQAIINFRPDIYKRDRKFTSTLYNAAH